jgi:hypothetical protein
MNVPNRIHISTLFSSSAYWRAMLRHSHDERFRKAAQVEYDAIDDRETWKIVYRQQAENQKIISLKWVFIHLQNRKRLRKKVLTDEADDIIFALSSSIDILIFQSRDCRRRQSSAALQRRCSRRQSSNSNWTSLIQTFVESRFSLSSLMM